MTLSCDMATVRDKSANNPIDRKYSSVNRFAMNAAELTPQYAGELVLSLDTGQRLRALTPVSWGKVEAHGGLAASSSGYNNLINWPDLTNRPIAPGSVLSWIGPVGGGPSTANDVGQTQALSNSGSITTTSNGQVIQNLNIAGMISIVHPNVIVRKCKLVDSHNNIGGIRIESGGSNALIEDCELDGSGSSAYGINNRQGGTGSTYRRCNIHGFENGIDPGDNDTVIDCYIWGLLNTDAVPEPHYDGIEFDGGVGLTLRHNQIWNNQGGASAVMIDNNFDIVNNVLVTNNLLRGGSYTVFCDGRFSGGPITNVTITNNYLEAGGNGYFAFDNSAPIHTGNVDYITLVSVD